MEDRLQGNGFARSRAAVESVGKAKLSSTSGQAAKEVVDLYSSSSDADEDEVQVTMVLKKSPPARKRKRINNHVTSGGWNATPISVNPVISIDDSDEEESKNYTPPRRNQKPARSHSRPSPRPVKGHQNSSQSSPSRRSDGVLVQKEVIELDMSDDETENNKNRYASSSLPSGPRQASETSSLSHITQQKQRNASPSLPSSPRQYSRIASSSQSTQQGQRKINSSLSSPVQQQASQPPRPSQSTQQRVTHYDLASSDEELNRDVNRDVEKKASKPLPLPPPPPSSPLKQKRKSSTPQKIVQTNTRVNNPDNEISALGISSNPASTKNISSSNLNPGADVAISSSRSKMVGKKRIENPESKKQHPRPKMAGMDDSSSDDIPQAAFADGGRKLAVRKRIEPTKDGGKNRDKHFITKDGNPPAIIQPLPEDSAAAQPTATTSAKGLTPRAPPVQELCAPPFKKSAIPPPVPALNVRPVPNPLLLSVEQQKDPNDKSNCTPASRGQQHGSAASTEAGSNASPPSKKQDTRPVPNPFLSSMEEHQDSLRSSNFTPDSKVQQSSPFKACNARNGPAVERPKPPPSLSQSLDTPPIPNPFLPSGEQRQESLLKFSCKAASTVQQPSLQKEEDNDPNGSYLAPTGATAKESKSPPTLHSLDIPPVPDPFLRPIEKHQESRQRSNSMLASSGISQSLPKTSPTRFNPRNGSHLAPVFATALAQGKGLDVHTVIPPTDILTKRDDPPDIIRTKKERLLMGIHLETGNEEFKEGPPEEDEPCFSIKSARQPTHQPTNRECSQEVKILTHQLITDEESSDATVEEAISDGVDPKIPRSFFKKKHSDLGLMTKIDFLSSTTTDQTGLPFSTFSVHGSFDDDVIYDFKVEIRKSTIPNSGNGAFLTFIGARELKSSIKKRNKKWWDKRNSMSPEKSLGVDSESLLIARFNDDRCAKLTLKGNDLYSAYNSCYLVPDSVDPETRMPKSNFDEFYTAEEISGFRDPNNKIGHMKVNKESDYIPAPNRTFSSLHKSCGLIDLGRYGPYHKEDRKTDDTFTVKSFIFSHEPSEWGFGVPEEICGEKQVIDITDDLTGKPSSLAQSNIPMWVNEIGHDKRLKQTVYSLDLDDRTVEYYLKIDEPLKKGDSIELFVDYYDAYEDVRNRKGYGLANLEGTVKSDEDDATRIMRNFSERDEIKNIVSDIGLTKMHAMLDYFISVYENLERIIRFFADETLEANSLPSDCPSAMQVVALRRLHWLGGIFKERVDKFRSSHDLETLSEIEKLEQCVHVVSRLQSFSFSTLFDAISRVPSFDDSDGINIKKFFEAEMVEEICYDVKHVVKAPLDSSVWCGVASDLTRRLCLATASILWRDDIESSQKATQLLQSYNDETERAARLIRCRSNLDELTFHAPFHRNSGIDSTDLVWESDLSSFGPGTNVLVHKLDVTPSSADNMVDLSGIANKVNSTDIQDDWYLCWQVILIVNAFGSSSTFLTGSSYSLSDLCKITGVQETHALYVINKGINVIEQPKRKKRKSSTPRAAPVASEWEGKPDEPLQGGWPEGWVKKVFVRRSGASAGHRDRYWHSPINGFKLRSMVEVKKFMKAFSLYGDESLAHKNFRSVQL